MPVDYILATVLAQNEGALGALFLDDSGETVDLACADELTPYEARIVGAYLGIYLRQLERVCEANRLSPPQQMHIEKDTMHIYAQALPDGYYVALLQRRPGLVAPARRSLAAAVRNLHHEFFEDRKEAS